MPQASEIVLTDGTTPVTMTPTARSVNGEQHYADSTLGQKDLRSEMWISSRDGGNDSTVVKIKMELPIIDINTDTGRSSKVETELVEVKLRHASLATLAQRQTLVAYINHALSIGALSSVVDGSEQIF